MGSPVIDEVTRQWVATHLNVNAGMAFPIKPSGGAAGNATHDGFSLATLNERMLGARRVMADARNELKQTLANYARPKRTLEQKAEPLAAVLKLSPKEITDLIQTAKKSSPALGKAAQDAGNAEKNWQTQKDLFALMAINVLDLGTQMEIASKEVVANEALNKSDEIKKEIAEFKETFARAEKLTEAFLELGKEPEKAALKFISLAVDIGTDLSPLKKQGDELEALARKLSTEAKLETFVRVATLSAEIGALAARIGEHASTYFSDYQKLEKKARLAFDATGQGPVRFRDFAAALDAASMALSPLNAGMARLRKSIAQINDVDHWLRSHGAERSKGSGDEISRNEDVASIKLGWSQAAAESDRMLKELNRSLLGVETEIADANDQVSRWQKQRDAVNSALLAVDAD